jgi:ubiquinone/menaquinone biosynthesis C-methylase UbiE
MTVSGERSDTKPGSYVPALGVKALTGLYDPVVAATTREQAFKRELLRELSPRPGQRILDLGCGTGTLALMIKRSQPGVEVEGVDADPVMLARAEKKSAEAGLQIRFRTGLAQELPYDDDAFDAVVSSLFFHHLEREQKSLAFAELNRVLAAGGRVHIADWGQPSDPLMALATTTIRVFDGFSPTRDNLAGRLPEMLTDAGLENVREGARFRTVFGTLAIYGAQAKGASR